MTKKVTFKKTSLVLSLIYIGFISLFALDVFSGTNSLPQILLALIMHLIPSFVIASITFLAWKNPKLGGVAFLILALVFTLFFKAYQDMIVLLIIVGPLVTIGILNLLITTCSPISSKPSKTK